MNSRKPPGRRNGSGSKKRLLLKLCLLGSVLFLLGIAARWLCVKYLAADYFTSVLSKNGVPPSPDIMAAFMEAAHAGLFWSHVVSLATAVAIAIMLLKMVIGPMHRVIVLTRRVAAGDFTPRVAYSWEDEIGELNKAFNAMTNSLHRMEELRKKLVLDIAHDIKAPLMNMRGYLEAMQGGALPPSAAVIESVKEETIRLGNLADNLMRLSVADGATLTMRKETGDLRQLVAESLESFSRHFAENEIAVRVDFSGPVPISADFEKLRQVIQNLVDNAWRYTPRHGRVTISIEPSESTLKVMFVTTGEPIPEEHIPHLFDRFYRVRWPRAHDSGGAGIGLAIVKELIEAHGGRVGAASAPDENRIWFELPR